ncbi:MAG: MarR family transcriptional regulator [Oligoflexia bacterium]|nr:MarR family transcriptional regulator [Oligoflexia bacterium]
MRHEGKNLADLHFSLMLSLRKFVAGNEPFVRSLTPQQMMVLIILDMNGSIRLSDLSKRAMVTHGTMVVAIQKLVKKGLILKKKDPIDERAVALSLSAKGKAIPKGIKERLSQRYKLLCENLPADEAKKLADCYRFMTKTFWEFEKERES